MKILVLGAQGQLGHALVEQSGGYGLGRAGCDVTHADAIETALETYAPSVVFNASAYNAVDRAETERDEAIALNAIAPGLIARACHARNIRFVHFSTDYVFGHGHTRPIDESHQPHPLSAYGRSKLFGEQLVFQAHPEAIVVRTTGLYSERKNNFVKTMLRLGRERGEVSVVADQFIAPTWVEPLATVALKLAEQRQFGTFHAVSQDGCSWFELARAAFENANLDVVLKPTTQAEWKAPAPRAEYSILDNSRLRILNLHDHLPNWRVMLDAFWDKHGADL